MKCIKNSGFVNYYLRNGKVPFKGEITSMPDDYTGEIVVYEDDERHSLFGHVWPYLVAGDYTFTFSDGCTSVQFSTTIDLIDDDFPSDPLASHFTQSGCNKAYADINPNERHQYWGAGLMTYSEDSFYQIAFTFDEPKETDWKKVTVPRSGEIIRFEVTFDEPYKDLYEKGAEMKVYLRLIDTGCTTKDGITTCNYHREEGEACARERLVDMVKFSAPTAIVPVPEIQDDIRLCQSNETTTLSAQSLNRNHTIQWYDENKTLLSEAPVIDHSIVPAEYVFYVEQTDNVQGCSSDKKKVHVGVSAAPVKSARVTGWTCMSVNPYITVTDIVAGYEYTIFSDAAATVPVMTFEGKEATMTVPVEMPGDNAIFYLRTAIAGGCALPPVEFRIETNKLELLPEKLPLYVPGVPYNVQLETDAQEPSFSYADITVPGISMTAGGLISGTIPESEGGNEWTFTVTVADKAVPNGCATAREYVLRTCSPAPEVAHSELWYCEGDLSAELTASPLDGLTLQWYDAKNNKLNRAPSPNTSVVGEQVFSVSQINADLQCESVKSTITVIVAPSPELNFDAPDVNICFGFSPVIHLTNLNGEYAYDIYSDARTTDKRASVTGIVSEEV
jgi:hypothetical protein